MANAVVPVAKGLHHASASKTDLLLLCQYWASPGVRLPEEPKEIQAQPEIPRFGRAFHKTMESHLLREPVLIDDIAETYFVDRDRLESYYVRASKAVDAFLKKQRWYSIGRLIEKKLAYDPFADTTRVLKSDGERDYSGRRPTELPGTADLALEPGANRSRPIVVFDWKSGQSQYDAPKNPQLRTLSLGLTRHWKTVVGAKPKETAAIVIIVRIDDEFMEMSDGTVDFETLENHRVLVRGALRKAISGIPALHPGMHCRYCPGLEVCPAHQSPLSVVDASEGMMEPAQVAHAYTRLVAAENLLKKVRKRITDYVEMNGPLALDNGKYANLVEYDEENLSKASINRALGKLEGETLISELRDRGCIDTKHVKQLREVVNLDRKKR
jgi:hypothetical protein